jgi:hypothetical protein
VDQIDEATERYQRARADLVEIISEANSSIKASRAALRELEAARHEHLTLFKAAIDEPIHDIIAAAMAELQPELQKHMTASVQRIQTEFDKLEALLFAGVDGKDLRLSVSELLDGLDQAPQRRPTGRRVGNATDKKRRK